MLAKAGDEQAFEELGTCFKPLIAKVSLRSGEFDKICYQECLIAMYLAIKKFE